MSDQDEFYLQDSRTYCGNDVFWWKLGGGYTTDLSKAQVFTKDRALSQHNIRHSDVPWPKAYIEARTRPAVDVQYMNQSEAHKDTGITILKDEKPKRPTLNCMHCGVFISDAQVYSGCPKCGEMNLP